MTPDLGRYQRGGQQSDYPGEPRLVDALRMIAEFYVMDGELLPIYRNSDGLPCITSRIIQGYQVEVVVGEDDPNYVWLEATDTRGRQIMAGEYEVVRDGAHLRLVCHYPDGTRHALVELRPGLAIDAIVMPDAECYSVAFPLDVLDGPIVKWDQRAS